MERAAEAAMGGGQSWKAYDIIMKWMGSRWRRRRKKPRRRRRGHNKNCFREWWDFYEQEMRLFIGPKKNLPKNKKSTYSASNVEIVWLLFQNVQ